MKKFSIIYKYIYIIYNILNNYLLKYITNICILLLSLWVLYVFIMMFYYTFK
jgi:hypothetical protein